MSWKTTGWWLYCECVPYCNILSRFWNRLQARRYILIRIWIPRKSNLNHANKNHGWTILISHVVNICCSIYTFWWCYEADHDQKEEDDIRGGLQISTLLIYMDHIAGDAVPNIWKTSQELWMLSTSLFDCMSLSLNVMIQASQFVRKSQLGG